MSYWGWLEEGSFRWSALPLIQDGCYGCHLGFGFRRLQDKCLGRLISFLCGSLGVTRGRFLSMISSAAHPRWLPFCEKVGPQYDTHLSPVWDLLRLFDNGTVVHVYEIIQLCNIFLYFRLLLSTSMQPVRMQQMTNCASVYGGLRSRWQIAPVSTEVCRYSQPSCYYSYDFRWVPSKKTRFALFVHGRAAL
jgi:hypothetical protein